MKSVFYFFSRLFGLRKRKRPSEEWNEYPEFTEARRPRRSTSPEAPEDEEYRVENYTDSMGVKRTRAVKRDKRQEAVPAQTAPKKPENKEAFPQPKGPSVEEKRNAAPRQRKVKDVRRARRKILSSAILFGLFILCVFIYFIIKQTLYVSPTTDDFADAPPPASSTDRLKEPLIGHDDKKSEAQKSDADLFDYSPLLDMKIKRAPLLPDKLSTKNKRGRQSEPESNPFESFLNGKEKTKQSGSENSSLLPPWRANAVPPPELKSGRPAIAIILDYNGSNPQDLALLKYLDYPLTVAIPAFSDGSKQLSENLRKANYEVLINLPLEPRETIPPGVKPIKADLSYDEIEKRFQWHHERLRHVVGFKMMFETDLIADLNIMSFLMATAERKGLLYVNSPHAGADVSPAAAEAMGTPYAGTDIAINPDNMTEDLRTLYRKAERYGYASAVAPLNEKTLKNLIKYLPNMIKSDATLIPISTVVKIEEIKAGKGK